MTLQASDGVTQPHRLSNRMQRNRRERLMGAVYRPEEWAYKATGSEDVRNNA